MNNSNSLYESANYQLIIWDCDGVLVDSEHLAAKAFHQIIKIHGGNISEEYVYRSLKGGSIFRAVDFVHQHVTVPANYNVAAHYRQISFDLFAQELKAVDGVMEIVRSLKIGQCIASNGPKIKINHNLRIAGLTHHFPDDRIFSGHEIGKFKPEPDLFLHAANSMNIPPAHCLVIEDSGHGANAARMAGMQCMGFAAETNPSEFIAHGAQPFADMKELYLNLSVLGLL